MASLAKIISRLAKEQGLVVFEVPSPMLSELNLLTRLKTAPLPTDVQGW